MIIGHRHSNPSIGAKQPGPVAEVPWLGPLLCEPEEGAETRRIAVSPNPILAQPSAIAIVPVKEEEGRWRMQGDLRDGHITRLAQPTNSAGGVESTDDQRWYEAKLSTDSYETEKVLVVFVYNQAPVIGKRHLPRWVSGLWHRNYCGQR